MQPEPRAFLGRASRAFAPRAVPRRSFALASRRESAPVDSFTRAQAIGVLLIAPATLLAASVLFKAEIVVISSVSEDYCHIVTPPDVWKVPLKTRLYLGHYHEYHYVSTRPI